MYLPYKYITVAGGRPAEAFAVLPPVVTPPPVGEAPAMLPPGRGLVQEQEEAQAEEGARPLAGAAQPVRTVTHDPTPTIVDDVYGPAWPAVRLYGHWLIVVHTAMAVLLLSLVW